MTAPSSSRAGGILPALVVGAVTFVVVAVAATALLEDVVWPSLFVGVPLGVLAGVLAAIATALYRRK